MPLLGSSWQKRNLSLLLALQERHIVLKTAAICPHPGRAGEKYNTQIHTIKSCIINLAFEWVARLVSNSGAETDGGGNGLNVNFIRNL